MHGNTHAAMLRLCRTYFDALGLLSRWFNSAQQQGGDHPKGDRRSGM
jgi:hypothetical protein